MTTTYQLDSTRVTLREYAWGTPWIVLPVAALLKLLRVPLPGSSDDPPVEAIAGYELPEESLPGDVHAKFAPLMAQLAELGFSSPIFHAIPDDRHSTVVCWATFLHSSGQSIARLHYRYWSGVKPPREYLFPQFITGLADTTFLVTTSGKPDLLTPPSFRIERHLDVSVQELWAIHCRRLVDFRLDRDAIVLHDADGMRAFVERYHSVVRDFHLNRGVFRPLPTEATFVPTATGVEVQTSGLPNEDVLVEIQRLERKKSGWAAIALTLLVSLGLFVGFGLKDQGWQGLLLLLGVLFFHELGHFVAMKVFAYRNVRMFFIPLLGAAVSGRHYNVPGWKKAIVSLMGPVPGILLGLVLGVVGMVLGYKALMLAATVLLLLNGFNLIPVVPLDGGWVLHATLFCRHPVLDVGFKLLAGVALVALGFVGGGRISLFIGVPLLISLPMSFRVARTARNLRLAGVPPTSADSQTIPLETAQQIISEVKQSFPSGMNAKTTALVTTQIFETLNARPPHWLATIVLLGVHACCFLLAVGGGALFFVAQHGKLDNLLQVAADPPRFNYRDGEDEVSSGAAVAKPFPDEHVTLLANFDDAATAQEQFAALRPQVPANGRLTRFGCTVMISVPGNNPQVVDPWRLKLLGHTTELVVSSREFPATVKVTAIAPNVETAEKIEAAAANYFAAPNILYLIPPWTPEDDRPVELRERHEWSRGTYRQVMTEIQEVYGDPRYQELIEKQIEAWPKKDQQKIQEIQEQQRALIKSLNQERLDKLRQQAPEKVDREIITMYEALTSSPGQAAEEEEEFDAELPQWNSAAAMKLGNHLGQLPMINGQPAAGSIRFSTLDGAITYHGLLVRFDYLLFEHVETGLPALAAWLSDQQCVDIKYDIESDNDEI